MQRYRTIIDIGTPPDAGSQDAAPTKGLLLELRVGDMGQESCHLDGKPVTNSPLAGLGLGRHHHFDFVDAAGAAHHAEVLLETSAIKQVLTLRYRYKLLIDGRDRCFLEFFDPKLEGTCRYCGYSLAGIEPVLDERKCPECGRHTPRE